MLIERVSLFMRIYSFRKTDRRGVRVTILHVNVLGNVMLSPHAKEVQNQL